MKKILLVDFCTWKGHHEVYFMRILKILAAHNYFVYASCTENQELRNNIRQQSLDNCQVVDVHLTLIDKILIWILAKADLLLSAIPIKLSLRFSTLISLVKTKRLVADLASTSDLLVFFPYADSIIPAVPTILARYFFPSRWIGLYMLPSYKSEVYWGKQEALRRFYAEKNFSLPSCQAVLVLHPLFERFLTTRSRQINCYYLSELVYTEQDPNSDIVNEIKRQANGRKIISLIGSVVSKKDPLLFLNTISLLKPDRFYCVMVGLLNPAQFTASEFDVMNGIIDRISKDAYIRLDYYIPTEEEYNSLVAVSDIVFLHYQAHPFSSNALIKAMALGKPVIINQGYIMEQIVKKYDWPIATNHNPEDIARIIETLGDSSVGKEQIARLVNDFSDEKFERVILNAVTG